MIFSEQYPIQVQQLSIDEWDQTMERQTPITLAPIETTKKPRKKNKDTDFIPSDSYSDTTATTPRTSSSSEQEDWAQK